MSSFQQDKTFFTFYGDVLLLGPSPSAGNEIKDGPE